MACNHYLSTAAACFPALYRGVSKKYRSLWSKNNAKNALANTPELGGTVMRKVYSGIVGALLCGVSPLGALADTVDPIDPQLVIVPFVSCGGATTCNGVTPFSLTSSNLFSAGLPTFGGTPIAFGITNNTGGTITSLSLTIGGTQGAALELWNSNTSGFNAATNPFTLATIDGFNSLPGTPCTGGGVTVGAGGGGTCAAGALPITFQWLQGTGVGIAAGASFVLQYQSPVVGDRFTPLNPVPLPAALPLFATGLGALGLLGWRRKRKAAALAA
jgi:hypothetical protein